MEKLPYIYAKLIVDSKVDNEDKQSEIAEDTKQEASPIETLSVFIKLIQVEIKETPKEDDNENGNNENSNDENGNDENGNDEIKIEREINVEEMNDKLNELNSLLTKYVEV